ncbi:MAG: hypothetical protein ACLFTT_06585 [Candidatus Hydrogenedentota bacterium]
MQPETMPEPITMAARVERATTGVMVLLSLFFLVMLAGVLPQSAGQGTADPLYLALRLLWLFVAVWAVFVAEFVVLSLLYGRARGWKRHLFAFFAALVPPLRPSVPPAFAPNHVWVPFIGWHKADKSFEQRLEQQFSGPMTVVALMILPILAIEFLWSETLHQNIVLLGLVEVGTRLIWLAFAIEFFVMVAVARKKVAYCTAHWIDLLIIVLPLVAFLRVLRLARLGRLGRLQRMSRVYRMRGIFYRLMRATVLLNLIVRTNDRLRRKRIEFLQKKLLRLEEQMRAVRQEIEDLECVDAGRTLDRQEQE